MSQQILLHLVKLNIVAPIVEIVNLSVANGIYIDNLKTFKDKGSRLDYNNYRPISLL